jgi:hypothetical protein
MIASVVPFTSTNDKNGVVIGLSDGTYDRCIAAIIPEST